jgi:peptidoglycan/LPS O-acetylase OafA/YrhL
VAHIFMAHTFVPGALYSISSVLWTIALEAHFYLLYPLLLRCRRRVGMGVICGALFGLMLALRVVDQRLPVPWRGMLLYNFPGRWWEWVLGAVLAERLTSAPRPVVSRLLALAALALSALAVSRVTTMAHGVLVSAVVGPFFYAAVIYLAARVAPKRHDLLDRLLLGIGVRSYSLYLTHPIALTLVAAALLWGRISKPAGVVALALGGSYLLMAIFFFLVERRFLTTRIGVTDPGVTVAKPDVAL